MNKELLRGSLNPINLLKILKHKIQFAKQNPGFFHPCGLTVFCGKQGSGKTLSMVQYIQKLTFMYPKAILVTNVEIFGINPTTQVIEYDGIKSLTDINNGIHGVIYCIDEIQLEFNCIESQVIPLEVMVEVSQQRKQRKHIIGTSQVFNRLAKPFREQINIVIACKNVLNIMQINKLIYGEDSEEKDGKLVAKTHGTFIFFHTPELYNSYDTYKKMKRYNEQFKSQKLLRTGGL